MKQILKRVLQTIAARFGRHTRRPDEPRLLILMYHRILPLEDPRTLAEEPGMLVSPETFRMHLQTLKAYFQIIPLSEWFDAKRSHRDLHGNYCAITFDDGWADNYEFAYPILRDIGVPATIFAVSEMIGTTSAFWPGRLAQLLLTIADLHPHHWSHPGLAWIRAMPVGYAFNEDQPTREQLSDIIAHAKVLGDQEIHRRLDSIEQALELDTGEQQPVLLDWDQIAEMIASGLIEIGSHTCHHTRLNAESPPNLLEHEVAASRQQLQQRTGQPIDLFCFPNGDYSPAALAQVQAHYAGAVTTATGWNSLHTDDYQLKRIGVHEDISRDRTAFLARISGWL